MATSSTCAAPLRFPAGAIGRVVLAPASGSSQAFLSDPGALDPFTPVDGVPYGGITLVPGDATIAVATMRDLVIDGAGDAGREAEQNIPDVPGEHRVDGTSFGLTTGFTLWQPTTAIDLFAAGGNLTQARRPTTWQSSTRCSTTWAPMRDGSSIRRPCWRPAATGSIIYGAVSISDGLIQADSSITNAYSPSLETMPAPLGEVAFLAGTSIYANGEAVDLSGANPALLSSPNHATYEINAYNPSGATEVADNATGTENGPDSLFAQAPDTPTSDLHADDPCRRASMPQVATSWILSPARRSPSGRPERGCSCAVSRRQAGMGSWHRKTS